MAWEPLGWSAAWFAEIEPFPSAVLAYRWPHVANWGDMTLLPIMVKAGMIEAPEILVGGTPCQAFSIAGTRKGLEDERGQLTIKFVEVANEIDRKRPKGEECIVVWENVPGVLSSKDNAFGCFLAALVGEDDALEPAGKKWSNAGIVYGPQRVVAWRILDAQYFGVAQRRRRVFVIASARDGFDPAQVLFEFEGMRRDTTPSREEGQDVTGSLTSRTKGGGFPGTDEACSGFVTPTRMRGFGDYKIDDKASALKSRDYKDATDLISYEWHNQDSRIREQKVISTLNTNAGGREGNLVQHLNPIAFHGSQDPCVSGDVAHPLGAQPNGMTNGVAIPLDLRNARRDPEKLDKINRQGLGVGKVNDPAPTVSAGCVHGVVVAPHAANMQVRRLTPTECERLQGFPDGHTRIPWRRKAPEDCPDGPRYKALGNSKAVPVVQWIGKRIERMLNQCQD